MTPKHEEPLLDALERLAREALHAAGEGDLAGLDEKLRTRRELFARIEADAVSSRGFDSARDWTRRLGEVIAVDVETERLLVRAREEVETRVRALGDGERGLQGYGGSSKSTGKRVDERR
jgi:hypothetical protein